MNSMIIITAMVMLTKTTPLVMAISILMMSLMASHSLFKSTSSSWLSFVMIMTFSSGMMTLFIYTSSMAPNEKSKTKKEKMMWVIPIATMMMVPQNNMEGMKKTMKMFSNQMAMLIMSTILIVVMMAISTHGHNPNQTLSSSF